MIVHNLADIFKENGIYYELYSHRPIFTFEDAEAIKEELGFSATETKALFIQGKKTKKYYVYFSFTRQQADFKAIKKLVGERCSVVGVEELKELTNQEPGAVCPFGYDSEVGMIVDTKMYQEERLVFAPTVPDHSMVVLAKDIDNIIALFGNQKYLLDTEETTE